MTKFLLPFIIFIGIILSHPMVYGENNHFSTGSCTDRCHVNHMAYRTQFQDEVFWHKTHSPDNGLECHQCHNGDPVEQKTHGNLIIQKQDCWNCHHKEAPVILNLSLTKGEKGRIFGENNCLKCHADVKNYINGNVQNRDTIVPDWMSRAVSCTECHKREPPEASFKPVRERCTECHNPDYGLLYDAWKEILKSTHTQIPENKINIQPQKTQESLRLVQVYGMHNFRLSQEILMSIKK